MQPSARFGVFSVVTAVLVLCTAIAFSQTVDSSTASNKFIIGYQGWHACQGDGNPLGTYVHWSHSAAAPSTSDAVDDIWPDLSEFTAAELFNTGLLLGNGQPAKVYSAYLGQTVNRHFSWMKDNGIDGVFAQRFTKDVFSDANWTAYKNQIMTNVMNAAQTNGRVFCVEYDISNDPTNVAISHLTSDWAYLTGTMKITNSTRYLKHRGKPLVAIFGLGFIGIPSTGAEYSPAQALTIISNFHNAGCSVMGGVPYWWHTLNNDALSDTNWLTVYKAFDVISPWAVGRYSNASGMDSLKTAVEVPDRTWCVTNNVDYMPVIFPGYSSANLNGAGGVSNSAPRLAGSFYWRQAYDALSIGCNMLFGAMFDEIDEGTAIYKLAPTMSTVPQYTNMFALNVDGTTLPNDWYLQVAGQITKAAHGGPLNTTLPITPTNSITVTSPNGGDFWFAGSTATVTWTTTGTVGNVSIDVSTDGGQSFRSLAYNVANNGSNTITVPFWPGTNCLVRVQSTNGSPVDWSDSAFTIKTNSQNGSTHLESAWSIAPGSVPYISTGTSAVERGLAYNALSNELVIVHHGTDGLSVNVIDADTGAFKHTLNTSGVSQGGFLLDRVGVTGDGVIYAANVQTSVSGSAPFKVYRWANSDPNTVPIVAYSGTAGFPNGSRVGDCFALRGAGGNTQILIGSRGASTASLLTTANGTNFSASFYLSDAPANTFGLCVAFDSTNTFWGKTNGLPLTKVSYNTTNLTATTIQTITTLPNFGTFGIDPANKLLAAIVPGNGPDQLNLYSITNPASPKLLDSWTFANTNGNPFWVGTVIFAGNRLFALDSDRGLLAFRIAANRVADLRFDLAGFCCGCGTSLCQSQFDHLNFISANGHYMEQSSDDHISQIFSNGNSVAFYYNNFNDGSFPSETGAQKAADIDAYVTSNYSPTNGKPTWLILNEISGGTWPTNAAYRQYVNDAVHILKNTYGYMVIVYAPFTNPANNSSNWTALQADAYIAVENYLSGQEVKNNGFSVSWCQSQYQSSVTSYASVGVPKSRLMLGEHFGQTVAGTSYGRAGVSASDWITAINARSQGAINVGFGGFLGYLWGNGDTNVSVTDLLSFEDAYASNNLPGPNPWSIAPVITKQPASQTAGAGTNVIFIVSSSGTAPLLFQWYKNGAPLTDGGNISGTTSDILTLGSIKGPEVGSYSVVISNTYGTVTSAVANLTFTGPLVIISQPTSQTNAYGSNTVFSVNAVGSTPISYRWTKNGATLSNGGNLSGATTANLTVGNAQGSDAGTYQVIVTNSVSSVTSSPALLAILDPAIVTQPQTQTAIVGSNVVLQVVASGTPTLSYQWQKDFANLSDGATVIGSTSSNLTLLTVAQTNQGTYTLVVTNPNGSITSQQAVLTVADLPPSIVTQPQSRTDAAGSLSTFTVVASGNGLGYQWYKNQTLLANGGSVSGATASTLTIANALPGDAASYTVVVTNGFGSVTSAVATLTIVYQFPFYEPFNYVAGTTLAGQSNFAGIKWDEVGTGTSGSSIQVTSGNLTTTNLSASTGNSIRFGGLGKSARFSFPSGMAQTSGTLYYSYLLKITDVTGLSASGVFVAGFNNSTGTQSGQPSEVGTRLYLRSATGGYNIGMSKDSSTTTDWVWDSRVFTTSDTLLLVGAYTFNPGNTTNDLAQMWINPNTNTFMAANPPTADLTTTNGNDMTSGQIASFVYLQRVSTEPPAMTVDELRIGTNWASVTPVTAPSITTQPQSKTVVSGTTASFSVSASGAPPLIYKWLFNGSALPGATTTAYTVTNAVAANAGGYSVVITNAAGSVTSATATLTVNIPPTITTPPSSQTAVAGSDVTFTVDASGTAPLSYQWQFNNSPIANATGSAYTASSVDATDVGSYSVVVTNVAGAATSAAATLTVNFPAQISQQPTSQTAGLGASVTFSASATGTLPIAFQWRKNGTNVLNATDSSFTITNVTYNDAASYSVVVTNIAGTDTSDDALLAIPVVTPQLLSISYDSNSIVTTTWSVNSGASYRFDYKNNLTDSAWTAIGNFVSASNSLTLTDGPLTNNQRYYQISSGGSASAPAGFLQLSLLGNSDSFVSIPFTRAGAIYATVASVSANTITVSNSPNWTANQFVYASGTQSNTYYARFTSGAAEGRIYPITANDTNTLTIDPGADNLSVAPGDSFAIEAYWTLNTVFPNGSGVNVSPTLGNRNTELLIPDLTSAGINLSATKVYFFNAGIWKQFGQTGSHNDDVLLPNTYMIVRHNVSTNTVLTALGNVVTSKVTIALKSSTTNQQDNSVALLRPARMSLNDSGLITSGAFNPSLLPAARTDELLTFDNTVANRNKSASAVYYYLSNGWRQVGGGTIDVGTNQVLGAGTGFIIRKATNASSSAVWMNAPNY